MGLQNRERSVFLGIKDGKISFKPSREEVVLYDEFSGVLTNIVKREALVQGQTMMYYDFHLTDEGKSYVLSVPVSSSVSRSIILSLASAQDIKGGVVTFSPYQKKVISNGAEKNFTNIVIRLNGRKLDWVVGPDQIPPVKKVRVGSQVVSNDEDLVAFVEGYVGAINKLLQQQVNVETGELSDPDVETEVFEDLPENL